MKKYDIKKLDPVTQAKCRAARRVCLYSSLAYTVGVLSLIPGIICALIIGFNYLNEQSVRRFEQDAEFAMGFTFFACVALLRSEEHTSELQSLMRISYAVFCLKKKNIK